MSKIERCSSAVTAEALPSPACRDELRITQSLRRGGIAGFTLILTLFAPAWWLHPFGPLLKNLPVAALVLVVMAREGR